jgi:hypothetical protein
MSSANQGLQVIRRSVVLVHGIQILGPVSMVPTSLVCNNGRDPDGIESGALDVVQFRLETFEGATAVASEVRARVTAGVRVTAGDTIRQGKVDGSGFPGGCVGGADDGREGEYEGGDGGESWEVHCGGCGGVTKRLKVGAEVGVRKC